MKRLLALCLAGSMLATPALAAPALTHLNTGIATSGSTATATGITAPPGSLLLVSGNIRTSGSTDTISLSNSTSESFTLYQQPTGSNAIRAFIGFVKTAGLSSGTVSVNTSGTFTEAGISVEYVTGFNTSAPEDTGVINRNLSSSTNPNVTAQAAAQSNDLLYSVFQHGNVTFTESTSPAWTNIQNAFGNTNGKFSNAWTINTGTGTLARNGTLSVSGNWNGIVIGIAPGAAGGAAVCTRSLLGVGC